MKKAAIVTITQKSNFGNRLQNYAVQKVLEKNGLKVETLKNINNDSKMRYLFKILKQTAKKIVKFYDPQVKRQKLIEKFDREHIKFSKIIVGNKLKNKISKKYDFFVCGSDQIWNLNYPENEIVNFLGFCDRTKKIAFSPSFGTHEHPSKIEQKYIKWILDFKYISCREEEGRKTIEKLTGRTDTAVLVDPTLLLDVEEWDDIEKTPKNYSKLENKKYILLCFLGHLSDSKKTEIEKIAEDNNCEIINIFDQESPYFECGPSEFIFLEKNAHLICTDSYHSCVFAIIYKRPFIIYDRDENIVNMNSRLDTLLSKFKLNDRKYTGRITKQQLDCDYNRVDKILNEEKKKARDFIIKCIQKEGE